MRAVCPILIKTKCNYCKEEGHSKLLSFNK